MTDDNKIVYLHTHRSGTPIQEIKTDQSSISVLACARCQSKTFALIYGGDTFPKLQCCVCGQPHGHVGWVDYND